MSFKQDLEAEGASIRCFPGKALSGRLSSLTFDEPCTADASKIEPTIPELDEDSHAPAYSNLTKDGKENSHSSSRLSHMFCQALKPPLGR
jgi:hypothetical protein